MSTNLVSNITQILNSNIIDRVASALGIDRARVESAIKGGVPALLAALTSLVSTQRGASLLNSAIAQQQSGFLSNLAGMIGGTGQKAFVDAGSNALTSLLGGSTMSALTNAVGGYSGVGESGAKSIMGLLGPVVMGALGQQQRASGLDASGLANLLMSQKDNIRRAIPAGLAASLSETGLFDSVIGSSEVRDDSTAARNAASARYVTAAPKESGWNAGWVLPALAVLALAGLAWNFLSRPKPVETAVVEGPAKPDTRITTGAIPDRTVTAAIPSLEALRGIKVGDVDYGAQVADAVGKVRSSLGRITDENSAKAAVADLNGSVGEFNKLAGMLNQLSRENRKSLANAIAAARPTLDRLFDAALQIPGVSAVIKPSVDSIRAELDTLATVSPA